MSKLDDILDRKEDRQLTKSEIRSLILELKLEALIETDNTFQANERFIEKVSEL